MKEKENLVTTKKNEFEYGCSCYESALRALESLAKDDHSGFSMSITKDILIRLIDGKPLTPIEDTEDIWKYLGYSFVKNGVRHYQCKRMSSLFKDVYPDGTIEYSDINRYICRDINTGVCWTNGFVSSIVKKYIPKIKFPYCPETKSYVVYCDELLTDKKKWRF